MRPEKGISEHMIISLTHIKKKRGGRKENDRARQHKGKGRSPLIAVIFSDEPETFLCYEVLELVKILTAIYCVLLLVIAVL